MARPSRKYERRDRERSRLHRAVREHLETFLAQARDADRDGMGVPAFVEAELRRFLECGVLAHGFARFRCDACGTDSPATIVTRVRRLLIRRGIWREGDDGTDYVDPTLHERLGAAAIQQVALTGPRAHRPTHRIRTAPPRTTPKVLGRRRARQDGFDLHANTAVRGTNRKRLERVCRYLLRPAVSESRVELREDGVLLELKTPYTDGTTHLSFEPTEFLARLAALVPRPQKNLLLYHGVFAANAKLRKRVVAYGRPPEPDPATDHAPAQPKRRNPTWAELMRRGLDIDSLECPKCRARMRFVACVLRPAVIKRILHSLHLPAEPIIPAPARAPPDDDDLYFDVA